MEQVLLIVIASVAAVGVAGAVLWRRWLPVQDLRKVGYVAETLDAWDGQLEELDPFGHESSAYFCGLSYVTGVTGSQMIPKHLDPSLRTLRRWAMSQQLIIDPNRQLITPSHISELKRWFEPGELEVALALESLNGERHLFIERPLVPLDVLVGKDCKLEITYCQIKPNRWNNKGWVISYGGVNLRYRIENSAVEYWSHTKAKRIVQRFVGILPQLPSSVYVNNLPHEQVEQRRLVGGKEIRPDRFLSATLKKVGRELDINLEY